MPTVLKKLKYILPTNDLHVLYMVAIPLKKEVFRPVSQEDAYVSDKLLARVHKGTEGRRSKGQRTWDRDCLWEFLGSTTLNCLNLLLGCGHSRRAAPVNPTEKTKYNIQVFAFYCIYFARVTEA